MQVDVNDVESHGAREDLAEDGVQVGPIVVEQATGLVDDFPYLADPALEHAQGRGVGEHDTRGPWPGEVAQGVDIQVAVGGRRHLPHGEAAHHGGGGIGAVRRIRDQDLGTVGRTPVQMVGANHRYPGKLPLGARHGRQRERLHPGDPAQQLLQLEHAGEKTLRHGRGGQRMALKEARQHGEGITALGVVLHGTGAQRVELRVDGEILLGKPRIVAHGIQFGHFRQQRPGVAQHFQRQVHRDIVPGNLGAGHAPRAPQFEDERFGHCGPPGVSMAPRSAST